MGSTIIVIVVTRSYIVIIIAAVVDYYLYQYKCSIIYAIWGNCLKTSAKLYEYKYRLEL